MQIDFEIDGMRLTRTSDAYVTEGSRNFVVCLFTFSSDWDNITKYALFARDDKTYEVEIVDGKCIVPYECARTAGQFQLAIVGKNTQEDVIATTGDKTVRVSSSEFEENPAGDETRLTNTFLVDTLAGCKEYAEKAKEYADKVETVGEDIDKAITSAEEAKASADEAKATAEEIKNETSLAIEEVKGYVETAKEYSENVNVFIPAVDEDCNLTWTNKAGLENPESVNLKGEKGDKGDTGEQGIQGERGERGLQGIQGNAGTMRVGTVTAGTTASVTNVGTAENAVLNFVLPKGDKGDTGSKGDKGDKGERGEQGEAATVEVGTVTSGTTPSVTNVGTSTNAVLDFVLPKGDKGDTGERGPQGIQGEQGIQGVAGKDGTDGKAATITIGKVTTGEVGTAVEVVNRGTETAAILDFKIPRGEKGDVGVRTFPTFADLPTTGEHNVLYIVADESRLYYWDSNQETYLPLSGGSVTYETYEGVYEAVSKTNEDYQLGTANKYLEEDIVVKGIPYSEIPNTSNGLTVTIGEGN